MMQKAQVPSTRQPIKRIRSAIEIPYHGYDEDGFPYQDDLIHHLNDDGDIIHDPAYPDPTCPCHDDENQGDTSSDYALALASYCSDFYSITPAGFNSGGLCLERHIADRVLRGVA